MLALGLHFQQTLGRQAMQVYAGRRGTYAGNHCELRAGSRVVVHQAIQDARPGRFADSAGNSGDRVLGGMLDIHNLIVDEL